MLAPGIQLILAFILTHGPERCVGDAKMAAGASLETPAAEDPARNLRAC